MEILVSGSRGLVGAALVPALESGGHRVRRLVREGGEGNDCIVWQPEAGRIEREKLAGIDAVIHLAGEPITGRWTAAKKQRIRQSRIAGTRLLAETLAQLSPRPRVFLCTSAIGYYGDRADTWLDEDSALGTGFLAEVCRDWEAAADPARVAGIRVATMRLGVVLSRHGGALGAMLLPFRLGLGGRVGSGQQWWSWISIEDVVGGIQHALTAETLSGPVNLVAPQPVTNTEFTHALGRVLRRPAILPAPAALLRLALGEMADGLLLSSARVRPARLLASGYQFRQSELTPALRVLLEIQD